jgi:lipid A 4'-phosphatase
MWPPKFAFDWQGRADESDAARTRAPVTARGMLKWALIVGALSLVLFVSFPKLDLACAQLFYVGNHQFIGKSLILTEGLRLAFSIAFYVVCGIAAVGLFIAIQRGTHWFGLGPSKWVYVALCLLTGPLIVTNIGLKDHWGRARPRDVVEFSGAKAFTPAFPPAKQCDYNCSFVSGEASAIFIVLFAAALLFRPYSRRLVASGVVLGGLAGLIRMTQGGHFLSDVVFAGVFMAITAATLQILFETIEADRLPSTKPGVV